MTSDVEWPDGWWNASTVAQIETQFNVGRRGEESQLGLATNTLGNLDLPSDFLSRPMEEQAWIVIREERQARHLVNYPGTGVVTGFLLEGVESTMNTVARPKPTMPIRSGSP